MPLGIIGPIAAGIGAIGTVASLIGGPGGPSGGSVSSEQLYEQQTIFGEQQGFEQQLAALMKNPSSVTSLPGYQFNKEQGEQSLFRGMNAQGYGGSGNMGSGLLQYGENYAMNTYNQQVGLLSQLAGITAATSPGQAGSNAIGAQGQSNAQMNNLLYQLGMAGGVYGGGGSYGSAGSGGTSSIWGTNSGTPWYLNPWNSGGSSFGGGSMVNTGPGALGG